MKLSQIRPESEGTGCVQFESVVEFLGSLRYPFFFINYTVLGASRVTFFPVNRVERQKLNQPAASG